MQGINEMQNSSYANVFQCPKRTTKQIKSGWKLTQQNPDKLQNAKWLFPGRAGFQKLDRDKIYFIISASLFQALGS